MLKKSLFIALLALSLVSFFACSKKAVAAAPAGPTVRLLTDATGIDDRSFNAAAWRGILQFYGETIDNPKSRGTSYDVITAQTPDAYIPNLKQASDEKYSLIVATGFTWADAVGKVSKDYPDQKYLIVDVSWVPGPNTMQATFAEHEGSYLVGVTAALKAQADKIKNPKFGFIGGKPGTVITKFEVGYMQGVLSVLPDAKFVDYYTDDWGKPELAKTQAKNWYSAGVYAIFCAAGSSGNGAIAEAKEERAAGKNVWVIGVDSDQYAEGVYGDGTKSAVLTSMIKRVESATKYALEQIKANTFKGETITFDLKKGGVDFSTANAELGADIVTKVNEIKAKIIDGSIKVEPSYEGSKKIKGFPQNLQASDKG